MHDFSDPLRELSDALPGQVLSGSEGRRYMLRERLGEGGQGWVFRARSSDGPEVVVKVLKPDATTGDALARFQREAQVLRALSLQPSPNPHLVRFFDHAYARVQTRSTPKPWGLLFTVLELVEGETLERALEREHPAGLGLARARRVLRHVVLALRDVHAHNVVHRDLKPSNVLLTSVGGQEIAKVTDFGLARLLDPDMQRTTNLAGATIGYAPPEQFESGNRRVGPQSDVFSLAAVFYELLTGAAAFPGRAEANPLMVFVNLLTEARPSLARAPERLPRELADLPDVVRALDVELARALALEPARRHATVAMFLEAIDRALAPLGAPLSTGRSDAAPAGPTSEPPTPDLSGTALMPPQAHVPARLASRAAALGWRRITSPLTPDAFRAIAVAPAGGRAVGLGPRGPAQWRRGHWTPLELPAPLDPRAIGAAAWLDDRLVLAGASPLVVFLQGDLTPATWRLGSAAATFHGVFADDDGIVLAGERTTESGTVGVVAELPFAASRSPVAARAWPTVDVPGCGSLRAVTRLGGAILACGDAGALVVARPGEPPRAVHVCKVPLMALLPLPDGTAVTVGGGGFVYRVQPTLEVELEAMQTTKDLLSLAQGGDRTLWCAGSAGRVLRREGRSWKRVGVDGATTRVRALHASGHRLLAFCDDGAVFEGTP